MPFNSTDAPHSTKKAKSPAAKKQWAVVANEVRKKDMAKGVSEKTASAHAKRAANSVIKKRKRR